ncbi:MAG: nucleotidyl transferase [Cyanobacteria bacterium PR.3.49]|nr:nucleotidyl transferase [Cyanobacteria bacterium PR.3.49]
MSSFDENPSSSLEQVPVLVLCGGRGSRLGSVTETAPKCLVDIGGKPFIEHQLGLLKRKGAKKVYLLTGYLSAQVEKFVSDAGDLGLSIECLSDGDELKGTGGAVAQAAKSMSGTMAVMYGDSYLDIPMSSVCQRFQKCARPSLMTIIENHEAISTQKSNVEYDPKRTLIKDYNKKNPTEAMRYIDYGLSFFDAAIFQELKRQDPCDLGDIFTELAGEGKLAGYEVQHRYYDINTPESLIETRAYLSQNNLW